MDLPEGNLRQTSAGAAGGLLLYGVVECLIQWRFFIQNGQKAEAKGNMAFNNVKTVLLSVVTASVLCACGDKPSDSMASETVMQVAKRDAYVGLKISDFARENGWVDEGSANKYHVRYNYQLRLEKPYAETVLENARITRRDADERAKNAGTGFFDVNAMQNNLNTMSQSMAVNQWAENQGDNFQPRFIAFLKNCKPCGQWMFDKSLADDVQKQRITSFMGAWMAFEELGFKDDAIVGAGVPRQTRVAFMKTEKGWMPAP